MSKVLFATWVDIGKVSVGAEVCKSGIRLRWESLDSKDGGDALITDYQARKFYEALKQVMDK